MQGVFSGILRGCAKQKVGAVLNLIAYYIISLPIGASLAFFTTMRVSKAVDSQFMNLIG